MLFLNHHRIITSFIISFLFVCGLGFSQTQDNDPPSREISLCKSPPIIDGKLDNNEWSNSSHLSTFIQREPSEGIPASESTNVFISYDENNLYFGIRCYDSQPDKIVANEMRRDVDIDGNDRIEIFLDTFNDKRNAFFFSTNPIGIQRDGLIRNEGENLNFDWNGIWYCESQIDSLGWTAEIAIPFKTLRFPEVEEQQWGMNIARFIMRNKEEDYWSPILRDYGYMGKFKISKFGHINGLHGLTQGTGLQIKPYVSGGAERDFESGTVSEILKEAGLDLKYSLTSNLTADLTLNTDFAQVEADQEQINLTRFDLFFPEKRDFFLEGAGIFWFGERFTFFSPSSILFFSRTIGLSEDGDVKIPLLGGLRATGKIGTTDIGALSVVTDRKDFLDSDDNPVHERRTNYSIVRLKKPIFGKSTIGAIGVNKQAGSDVFNHAFGGDWNFYLTDQTQIGGFAAKTISPDLRGKDWAGNIDFDYQSDFLGLTTQFMTIGDNFNPEVGFMPRTGVRKYRINPFVGPRPEILDIRQIFLIDNFTYYEDQQGNLQSLNNMGGLFTIFNDGGMLFTGVFNNAEALTEEFEIRDSTIIPIGTYWFNTANINYESDKSRDVSGKAELNIGNFFNGTIKSGTIDLRWKPTIHLKLEMQYQHNSIDIPLKNGKFATNLFGGRLNYAFNTKMFSKIFVQWNDADEEVNLNFLFNYQYIPGSDIYLVYNELWDASRGLKTMNRTLIAKVTYLFNF